MRKFIAPLIVGLLALFVADYVAKNVTTADATESESDFYRYGGAALGAWIAMSFVVGKVTAAA